MRRLGVISVWIGILATAVGLVVGFIQLAAGDDATGVPWLSLVPLGFALMLFGVGATQLTRK